jgi:flagellar protein FliO/FliZ
MRIFLILLSYLFSTAVFSEEISPVVGSQVSGNMNAASMILSLLMVLAVIVVSAFMLKRFNLIQTTNSELKVVTSLALSNKEKLVVVQVGKKQLLLGVTAQQINLLESLAEPLEVTTIKNNQAKMTKLEKSLTGLLKK